MPELQAHAERLDAHEVVDCAACQTGCRARKDSTTALWWEESRRAARWSRQNGGARWVR